MRGAPSPPPALPPPLRAKAGRREQLVKFQSKQPRRCANTVTPGPNRHRRSAVVEHICQCGNPIEQLKKGRPRKRCTSCSPRLVGRRPAVGPCVCVVCGDALPEHKTKYCSEQCKWRSRPRKPCIQCGEPSGYPVSSNCGDDVVCRPCRRRNSDMRPKPEPLTWACANCGELKTRMPTRGQTPRYCGKSCEQKAAFYRRRARLLGAFVEDINRLEVFLADGYRCHLCGLMTDRSKSYPHPKSPTVDHIVPLSKGGLHERSNCRTACARCNWAKQDRGGGEQFAITF